MCTVNGMAEFKIQKGLPIRPQQNPEAKLRDAAKMYEQYFLNEMVKAMRTTIDHSDLTEPNMAEQIYSEKLDDQYVETWSNRGGVGLADIIYNQIHDRFFPNKSGGVFQMHPQGPLQIQKGTTIKIDESSGARDGGIPIIKPQSTLPKNEVSFIYGFGGHGETSTQAQARDVTTPYDGQVLQMFRSGEDRQLIKLGHDDGLVSTVSFIGHTQKINLGDRIEAGQKLGTLSPYSTGLTWQLSQA